MLLLKDLSRNLNRFLTLNDEKTTNYTNLSNGIRVPISNNYNNSKNNLNNSNCCSCCSTLFLLFEKGCAVIF